MKTCSKGFFFAIIIMAGLLLVRAVNGGNFFPAPAIAAGAIVGYLYITFEMLYKENPIAVILTAIGVILL